MTQEQTHSGDGEFNVINGTLQNMKTLKIIAFRVIISDEKALSVFNDVAFARKMVKHEQKKGNDKISFVDKLNGALEVFPGETKDEITRKIIKNLNKAGAKINK